MSSILTSKWTKVVVFFTCLVPAGMLTYDAFTGGLGANPTEFLEHGTGDWTLRLVLITLAITPLRTILRQPNLIRFRRMLGLFAFFYGFIHFSIYLTFDQVLNFHSIVDDVIKRKYITVGFTGFVLMIPLALTSTAGWIRRLGGRRWAVLHRLIYATAVAGVIHYLWLVKSDIHIPLEYAAAVAVLLGWRIYRHLVKPPRRVSATASVRKQQSAAVPD